MARLSVPHCVITAAPSGWSRDPSPGTDGETEAERGCVACLGLGGCWDLGLGFGVVARLRGHWLEGACSGRPPGSLAGVLAAACPPAGNNAASIPRAGPLGGPPATWRRGRAACPRGGLAPGPARPPASSWAGYAVARRCGRPSRPRRAGPRPLPPGGGFGGPAHPPLPRLPPSQHPRASFKNSRWAGPSRSGRLWPPPRQPVPEENRRQKSHFPRPPGLAAGPPQRPSAPGRPASGMPGWPRPRPRRPGPRGPMDGGGHRRGARGLAPGPGPALPATGPGRGDGRRLHCLAVEQLPVLLRR